LTAKQPKATNKATNKTIYREEEVAFQLLAIIDLKKRYSDIEPNYYSFRTYINKDHKTGVYKITICGLEKKDRITVYGSSEVVKKKIENLIEHLQETLEVIELEENSFST